ncbi:MAG: flavin oxidoreductase [Lutibacter sp.]|uniref:flavin reductase family protein n=1 Tax=Lutibacter sp. TaxID=1925666 RepID=UPI0017E09156|nr:flavin reductase [Lutibacter sp.]MBT8318112.1 flavin reductase [Lutibacter sp.]NNJ58972.1 flavin oxidoreductase [Lutibacter sp.]
MKHLNLQDINNLNHLYKINLVNSIAGYKSVNLIATKSVSEKTNVAIFSSVIHLGSSPPLLGFMLRPATVPRNTYENIIETGYYTINHIHDQILEDAHHTSAKYNREISEFEVTKLETEYKDNFYVPFVKDCPIQLAMQFVEEYTIKANNTKLIVGEIKGVYIKDGLLQDDGFVDLSKGKVATINGLDGYAIPNLKKRLDYQRPKIF